MVARAGFFSPRPHALGAVTAEDDGTDAIDGYQALIRAVYEGRRGIPFWLVERYAAALWQSVRKAADAHRPARITAAYSPDRREALMARLQGNIYAFSAAKSYDQMTALRNAVYDAEGKAVPWEQYKAVAQGIDKRYNLTYLATERAAVIRGTEAALRWDDIQQYADVAPLLEYVTAGDGDVREEHAALAGIIEPADSPFWRQYYPPNGWNCRCSVRSLSQREAERKGYFSPDTHANMKRAGASVPKQWRRNTGTGELLPTRGTIVDERGKQLKASDYGMRPVGDIYQRADSLPVPGGQSPEDYRRAFAAAHPDGTVKTATGLRVRASDRFFEHAGKHADVMAELENVLKNPDEVWRGIKGGVTYKEELFTKYVRYYRGQPVVALVDKDMNVRTVYSVGQKQAEDFRTGILLKRK